MSRSKKTDFKKVTEQKGCWQPKALLYMDDFFKEQSERYRRMRKK